MSRPKCEKCGAAMVRRLNDLKTGPVLKWWCGCRNNTADAPLIKGGQGRSAREVEEAADAILLAVLGAIALLAITILFGAALS